MAAYVYIFTHVTKITGLFRNAPTYFVDDFVQTAYPTQEMNG